MPRAAGRHFLQIPGPTNVPDRVLRAMDFPTIDHRGPEFGELGRGLFADLKRVFKSTAGQVVIYPASGTGAWEAALVNTLSPGDRVLMAETGHFATLWQKLAARLGLAVEFLPGDWRHGADPAAIGERLEADREKRIKAVCVVHNETSTGVASRIAEVRRAIDAARHPALFMVDTISSLASIDYRHDEWGVDVTVAGSQKGLMLPPGLSFNCISAKALEASAAARLPRSYWSWDEMLANGKSGYFPYTPATNLLYGLREALKMLLDEEGLENVFARHQRHAEATRRARPDAKFLRLEGECHEDAPLVDKHFASDLFLEFFRLMPRLGKPSLCAANGHVLAGGMGLALSCDLVIAKEGSRFGTPEINVGLFPFMIMALIYRNVPRKKTTEMLLLGERLTARRLLGLALGMGGMALLAGAEVLHLGEAPLGVLFMLAAAIAWAAGVVAYKRAPPPMSITRRLCGAGGIECATPR